MAFYKQEPAIKRRKQVTIGTAEGAPFASAPTVPRTINTLSRLSAVLQAKEDNKPLVRRTVVDAMRGTWMHNCGIQSRCLVATSHERCEAAFHEDDLFSSVLRDICSALPRGACLSSFQ